MRRLLIAVTIVALLVVPQFALAGDADGLKAAYEKLIQAWNTNDNKMMASVHWNSADMSFFGPNKDTAFFTKGWEETAENY